MRVLSRRRWLPAAVLAVLVTVIGAVLAGGQGPGPSRPLLTIPLAIGMGRTAFSLGPGTYHVNATGCEVGVYVAGTADTPVLSLLGPDRAPAGDVTLTRRRQFTVSDAYAGDIPAPTGPCTAQFTVTRTGAAPSASAWGPVVLHCDAVTVPCRIPAALPPGEYQAQSRFGDCNAGWGLVDTLTATYTYSAFVVQFTSPTDRQRPVATTDFVTTRTQHLWLTHYFGQPCAVDLSLYALDPPNPTPPPPSLAPSTCKVTAVAVVRPATDGRSVSLYGIADAAIPEGGAIGACPMNQETVTVTVVGADSRPAAVQGSPATSVSRCSTSCDALSGIEPLDVVISGTPGLRWSNWCGGAVQVRVDAVVDGLNGTTTVPVPSPPACTDAHAPSTLVRGAARP